MTTVGLELTSFIDPRLTWKTVSKGRNTSRRSRRSAAKNMKMVQEHEKRSPKRLNSVQCPDSDKSNVMIHGRRFAGNMEHIPIKKRRLFFRSPSPPLQSPSRKEDSEGLVGGQCTSDENTCSDATTETQVLGFSLSNGSKLKFSNSEGNFDEKCVKSSNVAHGSGEDFSGIAILAAAACSDRLDNSIDDSGKNESQLGGLLDKEHNDSFSSATGMKESNTRVQSPVLLGKDAEQVEGVCVADPPKDSVQVASMNNDADDAGMSPIKEIQKVEQNELVASTSMKKESVESLRMLDSLKGNVVHDNKESLGDLPDEVADKTSENSGSTRDFRLHWDLNTVMDEWGHPLDDPGFSDSTSQLVDSQNLEDVKGPEAKRSEIQNIEAVESLQAKRSEATESGYRVVSQDEVCGRPESVASPDNAAFTSDSHTFSKQGHCSEVLPAFVTSILKENSSSSEVINHVVETSVCNTDSEIQPKVVNEVAKINHSVSLGLNSTKTSTTDETNDGVGSGKSNEVAEEASRSAMQSVKSEQHEFGILLPSVSGSAISEVKHAECKHIDDLEARNVLDEKDNKLADVTSQLTASKSLGSIKCEDAVLDISDSEVVSCEVKDLNCKNAESPEQIPQVDCEVKHEEVIGRPLESQPFSSGDSMAHLKVSSVTYCSSKLEDIATNLMTVDNDQAMDRVTTKETEEKPSVTDAPERDPLNNHESGVLVPKLLDHCVAVETCSKSVDGHLAEKSLGGGPSSLVSKEDLSQVNENTGTVIGLEGGYDSHLEDGELRESHCWEDNEGEDRETEHVDYDSDNREGIVFFEAANDSVQLSGEFLVGDCEKQGYRSDNFISTNDQPNPAKSIEENCSLRFPGVLSSVDESSTLKACSGVNTSILKASSGIDDSDKVEMDNKNCRSSIDANNIGKGFDNDPPRNARGASASGRDLQFPDRQYTDSMRRTRSGNFDCMHHTDGPNDSLARSQQPSLRMGRFGGRSWNPELKSIVANSTSEDDGERILRGSGDTSPRGRRRIISTSRSGYHFMRRGSPGDRDSDYGMGMMKVRDISPDNNPRSRFGRFNGINRGFREGFRRPGMYDGPKSGGGGPMVNRFDKRERSFSPAGNRFHRKSRSRSRTRSPDFRAEARMGRGRGRVPYQQANHAAEHTRERRSPVRVFNQNQRFEAIGSPGRLRSTTSGRANDFEEGEDYRRKLFMRNRRRSRSRSRSCSAEFRPDSKMGSMRVPYQPSADHIRDRRSPVRVFRPDQRYEGGGSPPVRLRSDEGLRPMMRPLRFPDAAQSGRGHEYNDNNNRDEFRRKPRNIFKRIHPIRQYDVEGDVRRFQYDDEDTGPPQNFRRNENYARPVERRPVEFRGPREERGNVRYNNSERMFYSGPKQYGGMPDFGEDGIPRRVRP